MVAPKVDMASADWLATHFSAKSRDRLRQASSLPIPRGANVLDLCCGSGLYIPLWLSLVGAAGHVVGIDRDPVLLDSAYGLLARASVRNWELQLRDVVEQGLPDLTPYNVVILFNSIGYFGNPLEVVSAIGAGMAPGALLILKDFDAEASFFSPRDELFWADLLRSARAVDGGESPVRFRNFLGRRLHTLQKAFPFSQCEAETWTQSMRYPFNLDEAEYIKEAIKCLLTQASGRCSPETVAYFTNMTQAEGSFYKTEEAVFVETEFLMLMRV